MTRYLVAKEGIEFDIPNYYTPGCFTWTHKPIVVVWGADFENLDAIIGIATDFQRDGGEITAEIEWTTPQGEFVKGNINRDVFLTVYCDGVSSVSMNGINQVETAKIKALFTTNHDVWQSKTEPETEFVVWKPQLNG